MRDRDHRTAIRVTADGSDYFGVHAAGEYLDRLGTLAGILACNLQANFHPSGATISRPSEGRLHIEMDLKIAEKGSHQGAGREDGASHRWRREPEVAGSAAAGRDDHNISAGQKGGWTPILVVTKDADDRSDLAGKIAEKMAPFAIGQNRELGRIIGQWDKWSIGGRWGGVMQVWPNHVGLKILGADKAQSGKAYRMTSADSALIRDVDWNGMRRLGWKPAIGIILENGEWRGANALNPDSELWAAILMYSIADNSPESRITMVAVHSPSMEAR